MIRLVDRYVGGRMLAGIGIAVLGLVAVFSLVRFGQELRDVGTGSYGVLAATRFVLHTAPAEALRLLTPAVLVGTAYAIGDLAAHNETVALLACGISRLRLLVAVLQVVLAVSLAGLGLGELVASPLAQRAHVDRSVRLSAGQALATAKGLWARDGMHFVNIRRVDGPDLLSGIYVYEFDEARRLRSFTHAAHASWSDGRWVLADAVRSTLEDGGVTTRRETALVWPTALEPRQVALLEMPVEELSMGDLVASIGSLRVRGESVQRQVGALWARAAGPLAAVAMATLAVAFFAHPRPRSRSGARIAAAALAGVTFQLADEMVGRIALLAGLPALLGSLALPSIALAGGLAWLADPLWRLPRSTVPPGPSTPTARL